MITYSIIQKSQLEGAHRLDAEFYQPEYLEISEKLRTAQRVADLTSDIRYGLYVEPKYKEEGVDFIRALNLLNFWIDGEILKIDKSKVPKSYRLKTADSLIVRSGANTGSVALVDSRFNDATFGSYTIRLRFNKINPFFAAVFLNTRYGVLQTQRLQTGMAQPNLNIPNIKEIRIPTVSEEKQKEIETLCEKIEEEREKSENLYSQAENLLFEELGLKNFEVEDNLSYIVNLSEVKSAHRADAEYFQPKYDKLIEKLKKIGADSLLNLVQNVAARFNPKSQPAKIFQYVELSNITSSVGTIDGFSEVSGDEAPSRAKRVLKANDVILSSVEGSLEKVALVRKEQEGYLASNGFFQFRSKDILPEVLLVLAKSFFIQMQFEKETTGTILTAVPKEAVKNIIVPKISESTQQKIADLVQKSHNARSKAKQLLEQAKNKVEKLIEK